MGGLPLTTMGFKALAVRREEHREACVSLGDGFGGGKADQAKLSLAIGRGKSWSLPSGCSVRFKKNEKKSLWFFLLSSATEFLGETSSLLSQAFLGCPVQAHF